MANHKDGRAANGMSCPIRKLMFAAVTALAFCLPLDALQADTLWTPSLNLLGMHDDNILFSNTNPQDDYVYMFQPALQLNYNQELTRIDANAIVFVRRFQDNDNLNDEIYNFDIKSTTNVSERFRLAGGYQFKKDTTLDSELQEVGRIFFREDRFSHNVTLAPTYNLNERMSIGLAARYRTVTYDSDTKVDYSVWDINIPLKWRLITQVDSIYVSPGYTYRDSENNRSKSYNLRLGWDHETTERLNLNFSIGARYTEYEDLNSDDTAETWSGLGSLQLTYDFETSRFMVDFQHDLRNTASGDQVNVTRVIARLQWNFSERVGLELNGRYYYTTNDQANNDFSSQFYQASPELFYSLTENHRLFIAYEYAQEHRDNIQNNPTAERNRIWAGIRLNFPMNRLF